MTTSSTARARSCPCASSIAPDPAAGSRHTAGTARDCARAAPLSSCIRQPAAPSVDKRSWTASTACNWKTFAVSRMQRASTNDADRLRKYLARFGLDWEQVREGGRAVPQD
ncbi:hypothetical protein DYQ93_13500 [Xanthomonas sp. LMG 8992]|nr:hypothetical protein [Xanthomonas sp. LMG 8992]